MFLFREDTVSSDVIFRQLSMINNDNNNVKLILNFVGYHLNNKSQWSRTEGW